MKVTVLLLGSALFLPLIAAFPGTSQHNPSTKREAKPGIQNLKHIIDLAEKYNQSLTWEFFVDDVSHLVDAGCEHEFFCKVHDILHKRGKHFEELVRNLDAFFNPRNVNCTVILKNVTTTGVSIQLPELMRHLIICIRKTIFKGNL
ncbi:hypothetical protein Q8A73_022632 [Channa argus]|nr:hypothetical protein Q8A73_022632 [Channa argus]